MRPIPPKLREQMANDPYYKVCARKKDGSCTGRITWEHTIIHAGRQLNEPWSIIPLCAYHHEVDEYQDNGDLDKSRNVQIALNRATNAQLEAISKAINYKALRDRLNKIYDGNYSERKSAKH